MLIKRKFDHTSAKSKTAGISILLSYVCQDTLLPETSRICPGIGQHISSWVYNHTAAHKIFRLRRWFTVRTPHPVIHFCWKGRKIMFNSVPQCFKVVFNETHVILLHIQVPGAMEILGEFVSQHDFPMIQFPSKCKSLVTWSHKIFSRTLQRLVCLCKIWPFFFN